MRQYRIRRTDDEPKIEEITWKIFKSDEEVESEPDDVSWLVWDDRNKVVGFCSIRPLKTERGYAYLSKSALLYEARGKGLHKRMIRVRVMWARKNGYKAIITYVERFNIASFKNLLKLGFEPYKPIDDWAGEARFTYLIKYL